jgi:hypothetical protein
VRYGRLKYVVFRDADPLLFDVIDDPGEQRNLLSRGIPDHLRVDAERAKHLAETSIDFEEAEGERLERDGNLAEIYGLSTVEDGPDDFLNCYRLPDGRTVSADDQLYRPRVALDER